jgi:hypothetical protein
MELIRLRATSGWNPIRYWAIQDGICTAAIYLLLLPRRYLQMECTEKMDHPIGIYILKS